ncbi:hypothetical protein EJB05_45633, partial [Eragrostis curvula]
MASQSISQDGNLLRWSAEDSSHGASVKSRLAISGSGGAGCCCDDDGGGPWQMEVSLASTEASSGPARCAPPRRRDGKLRRAASPRRRKAALS